MFYKHRSTIADLSDDLQYMFFALRTCAKLVIANKKNV